MTNMEYSAGGVLFTHVRGRRLYVIVTELDGHTGLPKGHIEPGETPRMTALREIREETGIRAALYPEISFEERYPLPHGGEKQVTYFLATYRHQALCPEPRHVRGAELLPLGEALRRLTFPGARRVLQEADAALRAMEKSNQRKE